MCLVGVRIRYKDVVIAWGSSEVPCIEYHTRVQEGSTIPKDLSTSIGSWHTVNPRSECALVQAQVVAFEVCLMLYKDMRGGAHSSASGLSRGVQVMWGRLIGCSC